MLFQTRKTFTTRIKIDFCLAIDNLFQPNYGGSTGLDPLLPSEVP